MWVNIVLSTTQSIRQNVASPRIVIADSLLTWRYLAITHSLTFANNWLAVWSTINIKSNNKNHSSTQTWNETNDQTEAGPVFCEIQNMAALNPLMVFQLSPCHFYIILYHHFVEELFIKSLSIYLDVQMIWYAN
jgi:hypothetical protein